MLPPFPLSPLTSLLFPLPLFFPLPENLFLTGGWGEQSLSISQVLFFSHFIDQSKSQTPAEYQRGEHCSPLLGNGHYPATSSF